MLQWTQLDIVILMIFIIPLENFMKFSPINCFAWI